MLTREILTRIDNSMFLADNRAITAFFRVEFRGDGVPVNRGNPRRKGTGALDIPCPIALSCFFSSMSISGVCQTPPLKLRPLVEQSHCSLSACCINAASSCCGVWQLAVYLRWCFLYGLLELLRSFAEILSHLRLFRPILLDFLCKKNLPFLAYIIKKQ